MVLDTQWFSVHHYLECKSLWIIFEFLQEGEQFSEENGMFFIETSAKTALNINELFYEMGE